MKFLIGQHMTNIKRKSKKCFVIYNGKQLLFYIDSIGVWEVYTNGEMYFCTLLTLLKRNYVAPWLMSSLQYPNVVISNCLNVENHQSNVHGAFSFYVDLFFLCYRQYISQT